MVNYPDSIDTDVTLPPLSGSQSTYGNPTVEDLRQAILAIETELGILPAGPYMDVRTRLNILELRNTNSPNVANPVLIGSTGVTIQVGTGDPAITLPAGTPGSLFLQQDANGGQGLYSYGQDGLWARINEVTWSNDLAGSSDTHQWLSGISGANSSGIIALSNGTSNLSLTMIASVASTPPSLTIAGAAAFSDTSNGGDVNIVSGANTFSTMLTGNAGNVNITGGTTNTYGVGGNINLTSGGGVTGGNINISSGSGTAAGNINVVAGLSNGTPGTGYIHITAGPGMGHAGGDIVLTSGTGTQGGSISLTSANGSGSGGGNISVISGNDSGDIGGTIDITAGSGSEGGTINITGGAGNGNGGGKIYITAGADPDGDVGGDVSIIGGACTGAPAGRVFLIPGAGTSGAYYADVRLFSVPQDGTVSQDAMLDIVDLGTSSAHRRVVGLCQIGNEQVGISVTDVPSGDGVVWIAKAQAKPTSHGTTGGVLYVATDGSLHYLGPGGTDSLIALA